MLPVRIGPNHLEAHRAVDITVTHAGRYNYSITLLNLQLFALLSTKHYGGGTAGHNQYFVGGTVVVVVGVNAVDPGATPAVVVE